jgi:A/G-specific adenine glycosylase
MTCDETADTPDQWLVARAIDWFATARRPLPWRDSGTTPWGVLVSEFMLQQTQVDRVIPRWQAWIQRWPRPEDLAAASVAEALRQWDRLGYPRRARWLHAGAVAIRDEHGGQVPTEEAALLALPGVGPYTAAAVRAFAFGLPGVVLDTNVRRVIARAAAGQAGVGPSVTADERARAARLADHPQSARWSAAVMELGALVCTAARPDCSACPIAQACSWRQAGYPAGMAPRRQAPFAGSDRQVRGLIMATLRDSPTSVPVSVIEATWPVPEQRDRAFASLVADGLVEVTRAGRVRLPR